MNDLVLNLFDYEQRARDLLSAEVWETANGGRFRTGTDARSRYVLDSILLRPRVLSGVDAVDTSVDVSGVRVTPPVIGGAGTAFQASDSSDQAAVVAAAGEAGTVQIASCSWGHEADRMASEGHNVWLQLPIFARRSLTEEQAERAVRSGFGALVLDTDVLSGTGGVGGASAGWNHSLLYGSPVDGEATWDSVDWLRSRTDLPLVVKGALTAEDARHAVDHGATAIIVSCEPHVPNLPAPIDVLPEVVDEVSGRCEVYLAGGIRRGIDVLKTLAMGATACVVERPLFFGFAVGGQEGIVDVYSMLRNELVYAMETCGVRSVAEATPDLVAVPALRV